MSLLGGSTNAHDRLLNSSIILGSWVAGPGGSCVDGNNKGGHSIASVAESTAGIGSNAVKRSTDDLNGVRLIEDGHGGENVLDTSPSPEIDRRAVWGLYCSWAMIGLVYGFVGNYINIPICEYIFGPMDTPGRTTTAQCNVAPSITCMPWNFQVFYGLILDRVGFFGTRRKGWVIFGWTMSLLTLGALAFVAEDLATHGMFFEYMLMFCIIAFFYIFATVSCDGMTIEFGKLEPPESRGYILTTGQMVRFASTVCVNLLGIIGMNGSYYYPKKASSNSTVFPFQLKFWEVHVVLLACVLPLYVAMVFLLKDPPKQTEEHHSLDVVVKTLWTVMKTRVMFSLVMFGICSIAIASMQNPALNIIAFIATPSTFQLSLGTMMGNVLFLVGVWIFRKYLMNRNWRLTFVWTASLLATNGVFQLLVIYNAWGVAQSGWFYALGSNILYLIQGISQVLASLSVIEISPSGYEASIYEFLTSMQNSGITLNTNLQNILLPMFNLDGIAADYATDPAKRAENNRHLAIATGFTIGLNLVGCLIFCWFLPKNKAQCRKWFGQWHLPALGAWNLIFGGGVLFFSLTVSILSAMPSTDCLEIAGGSGCH